MQNYPRPTSSVTSSLDFKLHCSHNPAIWPQFSNILLWAIEVVSESLLEYVWMCVSLFHSSTESLFPPSHNSHLSRRNLPVKSPRVIYSLLSHWIPLKHYKECSNVLHLRQQLNLLININMSTLGEVIRWHELQYHHYVVNTQLYILIPCWALCAIQILIQCLEAVGLDGKEPTLDLILARKIGFDFLWLPSVQWVIILDS